jgi:hypothetical protein
MRKEKRRERKEKRAAFLSENRLGSQRGAPCRFTKPALGVELGSGSAGGGETTANVDGGELLSKVDTHFNEGEAHSRADFNWWTVISMPAVRLW